MHVRNSPYGETKDTQEKNILHIHALHRRKTHTWYHKSDQEPKVRELSIGPRGELTISLLNGHVSNYPANTYLYAHRLVQLSVLIQEAFAQWTVVNTTSQVKEQVSVESVINGISVFYSLPLRLREICVTERL